MSFGITSIIEHYYQGVNAHLGGVHLLQAYGTEKQEREIAQAIEAGFREGKDVVVLRASGDLYRAEVHRIESAVGMVPNVNTIHIAVKETQ